MSRAADEYTVEAALAELREMFPGSFIRVRAVAELEFNEADNAQLYRDRWAYVMVLNCGEVTGITLNDCMAQVKKWREVSARGTDE